MKPVYTLIIDIGDDTFKYSVKYKGKIYGSTFFPCIINAEQTNRFMDRVKREINES